MTNQIWNPATVEQLGAPLQWEGDDPVQVIDIFDQTADVSLNFEHVAAVFGVMAAVPHRTFDVVTKHPLRASRFFEWMNRQEGGPMCHAAYSALITLEPEQEGPFHEKHCPDPHGPWPLPNVTIRCEESAA